MNSFASALGKDDTLFDPLKGLEEQIAAHVDNDWPTPNIYSTTSQSIFSTEYYEGKKHNDVFDKNSSQGIRIPRYLGKEQEEYYVRRTVAKSMVYSYLPTFRIAKAAYEQGYITAMENRYIPSFGRFNITGRFLWNSMDYYRIANAFKIPRMSDLDKLRQLLAEEQWMPLTKSRILGIQTNTLLGDDAIQTTYVGMEKKPWM